LAVALINRKEFGSSDFRKFHPGGTLGQRLYSKVRDLMLTDELVPRVYQEATMSDAIAEIDRLSFGVTFVLNKDDALVGIITDGDIRRMLAKGIKFEGLMVDESMTRDPRRVGPDTPAYDALDLMEKHQITVLPITDKDERVLGILHLHDILGKGEFKFNGA
jgi:arabinose-5-phosphate isomerase